MRRQRWTTSTPRSTSTMALVRNPRIIRLHIITNRLTLCTLMSHHKLKITRDSPWPPNRSIPRNIPLRDTNKHRASFNHADHSQIKMRRSSSIPARSNVIIPEQQEEQEMDTTITNKRPFWRASTITNRELINDEEATSTPSRYAAAAKDATASTKSTGVPRSDSFPMDRSQILRLSSNHIVVRRIERICKKSKIARNATTNSWSSSTKTGNTSTKNMRRSGWRIWRRNRTKSWQSNNCSNNSNWTRRCKPASPARRAREDRICRALRFCLDVRWECPISALAPFRVSATYTISRRRRASRRW